MDPYREITRTPGCDIHASKSKLQSYTLSSVYNFVRGEELSGAHCSLVDAKAQASVVMSRMFRRVWRKNAVTYVLNIFSLKDTKRMDALFEPTRKVHNMWKSDDKAEDWVPQRQYQYLGGSQGGTEASPSARMIDMASTQKCSIVEIFL